jgi:Na+/H+ antiporter
LLKFKKEKFVGDEHFLFQKLEKVWNFELANENFKISGEVGQSYFEILNEQQKALCELNKDPKTREEVTRTFYTTLTLRSRGGSRIASTKFAQIYGQI